MWNFEVHPEPLIDESRCYSPYSTQENAMFHPFSISPKQCTFRSWPTLALQRDFERQQISMREAKLAIDPGHHDALFEK